MICDVPKINTITCGDCLEVMQSIPDKSVDMVLCDLPYGTTACKWDTIIPFEPLWKEYKRVIKDNGAIVLTASQPFTSALVMSNVKMFKCEWIWEKESGTGFLNAKKYPLKNTENILVFFKKIHKYNPQMIACKPHKGKYSEKNLRTEVYGNAKIIEPVMKKYYQKYPVTGLKFKRDKNNLHPTQKPVALFEYLIRTYTNEGDTVLDNCIGSGTTAIACINTGRNFIGIEKDKEYYKKAEDRINILKNKQKDTEKSNSMFKY